MTQQQVYLIANAHLDPFWLWEWQEGAAAAISTFRTAADLCEEFNSFVFNHNEALLYEWIREFEPKLFKRIQRLARAGRWHIMGGWFLQPDCNMVSGEAMVRQILTGRAYFKKYFRSRPTTAMNFDPFGHSRGLVQILARSGYDSYLVTRPAGLYPHDFRWQGFAGSEVLMSLAEEGYHSLLGKAVEKIQKKLSVSGDKPVVLTLWGVGNHGGGPSRLDLQMIAELKFKDRERTYLHSTPEDYFKALRRPGQEFPVLAQSIIPFAVGCYTSQQRIKRNYRRLEHELFLTEKLAVHALVQNLAGYPEKEIADAQRDLMLTQFHDALPGSSIQPAEEMVLNLLGRGLETLARVKLRMLLALTAGQKKVRKGEQPIFVFNPHPWPVEALIDFEFNLEDQNWSETFTQPHVFCRGKEIPAQVEREASNIPIDWRKRIVFRTRLEPGRMNRFDCRMEVIPAKPKISLKPRNNVIQFSNSRLTVKINARTGLLDQYQVDGKEYLARNALRSVVLQDDEDPWAMLVDRFDKAIGHFTLLSPEASARLSGVRLKKIPAVRVIEEGPVRTIVEAVFGFRDSFLIRQYILPAEGAELQVRQRVFWNEKNCCLKLAIPTPFIQAAYRGETMFGVNDLEEDGREAVAQRWTAVIDEPRDQALTIINDSTYGSDFRKGECRMTLLRSAAYSAYPIPGRDPVPQDRFTPRIDQGEREFNFWLNGGPVARRLDAVTAEASVIHEAPPLISFFPGGEGRPPKPLIRISDRAIQLTGLKRAQKSRKIIARLFNSSREARSANVGVPMLKLEQTIDFQPYEVRTLSIDFKKSSIREVNLIEE